MLVTLKQPVVFNKHRKGVKHETFGKAETETKEFHEILDQPQVSLKFSKRLGRVHVSGKASGRRQEVHARVSSGNLHMRLAR
jgi:hypothetical protein